LSNFLRRILKKKQTNVTYKKNHLSSKVFLLSAFYLLFIILNFFERLYVDKKGFSSLSLSLSLSLFFPSFLKRLSREQENESLTQNNVELGRFLNQMSSLEKNVYDNKEIYTEKN